MPAEFQFKIDHTAVQTAIEAQSKTGRVKQTLTVGYTAPYALFVHEDLETRRKVGQAKFLEFAARRELAEVHRIIAMLLEDKKSVKQALERAGRYLMLKSQELCPVDTGALRASAFFTVK